jgi:hypothetical protein
MIHYHGTPITPKATYSVLGGRHFCVSFADPRDIYITHNVGQSVMVDNGAFTYWKRNPLQDTPRDWTAYYEFIRPWLDYPTTWAVIPDVINGTEMENDRLICEALSAFGYKKSRQLAPVWHLHESLERLERLATVVWERIAFGSSRDYALIGSDRWNNRMNEAFNRICRGSGAVPCWIHMLRGMSLSGSIYPFTSVDSTDIARNHHEKGNQPREMAEQWDAKQSPARCWWR